jgi:hypothetical protein
VQIRAVFLLMVLSSLCTCTKSDRPSDEATKTRTTAAETPAASPTMEGNCKSGETYYVPGCGINPIPKGCHRMSKCETDAECSEEEKCVILTYNPCWNSPCAACGSHEKMCIDSDFADIIKSSASPHGKIELPDFAK